MIKDLVDIYTGIIQLLLLALIGLGGYLGFHLIPETFLYEGETINLPAFVRVILGAIAAFLTSAITFGPMLILLDIREGIRSLESKVDRRMAEDRGTA